MKILTGFTLSVKKYKFSKNTMLYFPILTYLDQLCVNLLGSTGLVC